MPIAPRLARQLRLESLEDRWTPDAGPALLPDEPTTPDVLTSDTAPAESTPTPPSDDTSGGLAVSAAVPAAPDTVTDPTTPPPASDASPAVTPNNDTADQDWGDDFTFDFSDFLGVDVSTSDTIADATNDPSSAFVIFYFFPAASNTTPTAPPPSNGITPEMLVEQGGTNPNANGDDGLLIQRDEPGLPEPSLQDTLASEPAQSRPRHRDGTVFGYLRSSLENTIPYMAPLPAIGLWAAPQLTSGYGAGAADRLIDTAQSMSLPAKLYAEYERPPAPAPDPNQAPPPEPSFLERSLPLTGSLPGSPIGPVMRQVKDVDLLYGAVMNGDWYQLAPF